MSKPVTPEKVKAFHRFYARRGSFAEVACITGRSVTTIVKYIRMAGMTKSPSARARTDDWEKVTKEYGGMNRGAY